MLDENILWEEHIKTVENNFLKTFPCYAKPNNYLIISHSKVYLSHILTLI